jgi:hypothetical protein
MSEPTIQVLSSTKATGERRYQLSPVPSDGWWRAWEKRRDRWSFVEVGRLPPDVEVATSPPDEIVATGVSEQNSEVLDRDVLALVHATNRERAMPSRD